MRAEPTCVLPNRDEVTPEPTPREDEDESSVMSDESNQDETFKTARVTTWLSRSTVRLPSHNRAVDASTLTGEVCDNAADDPELPIGRVLIPLSEVQEQASTDEGLRGWHACDETGGALDLWYR